jgi:peptidyl-dipeptidase Dcp
MKYSLLMPALVILIPAVVCMARSGDKPFMGKFNTPFEVPPFDKIKPEHFMPAFEEGMKQHDNEIEAIVSQKAAPTFQNTLVALDRSGKLLTKVSSVFFNLTSANTSDTLQKISKSMAPKLSKHEDEIMLNSRLFARIKAVYDNKGKFKLDQEQKTLLEKYYKEFTRGGANLSPDDKKILVKINEELSLLAVKFSDNLLKETNSFELVIDKKEDLAGLPASVVQTAKQTAQERGHKGDVWVFTLKNPSVMPFLQYAGKRELREKIYKAYISRCSNGNEHDNQKILSRIASLRVKRANLLGYKTHADYILEENMAKTPDAVFGLLDKLWNPAVKRARQEAAELQSMIDKEGGNFKLEAWDWSYYAEKLRKEKYALDDEQLRPYFKLENVRQGAFDVAHKLYGLTFTERFDIPKYHPDVKVYEVKDSKGKHVGILYTDYFPRDSKRGGAWMNSFREQSIGEKGFITPIVANVCNFSKPVGDKPALLTFEEVTTLFHEFGHALHGLLSNCKYEKLAGTSVPRDFVELPSQINENWAGEAQVLRSYAKHYLTGQTIPDDLIKKIENSSLFNQGFATVEYLAASYLDLYWHTLTDTVERNATQFEKEKLDKLGLIPEIGVRYKSPYFQHIFSGGYSSGYYSYIWAEVLDADAFDAFKKNGIFDKKTADAFRNNVLTKGGSDNPMTLYKNFRGQEPDITPLLKRRGLN